MITSSNSIVNRALSIADLKNTNFLTHEELTGYLNDAFTDAYRTFINFGDKQFVREVYLRGSSSLGNATEYEIPFDLYQIHSLRDPKAGVLYTRAATNSSTASGTYEVVNNTIRLNGIVSGDLLLTYYVKPLYLSFPDKTIPLDLNSNPISTYKNRVLLSTGNIYDIITSEQLGAVGNVVNNTVLTDGYVMTKGYANNEWNIIIANYQGNIITNFTVATEPTIVAGANGGYYFIDGTLYNDKQVPIATNLDNVPTYVNKQNKPMYQNNIIQVEDFTVYPTYIAFDDNNNVVMLEEVDENKYITTNLDIHAWDISGFTEYGIIVNNGTSYSLVSRIPDTNMNFPNNLYYDIISYSMALRFLLKQNADVTSVNAMYENAYNLYKKSISSNGGFARIANVYTGW